MFRQCRLPQPFSNPSFEWRIISFSIEAISNFNALPLQARLGLLFLFLPFFCLPVLSPAWMGLVFSHPGSPLFWIRSQLAHTAPTGPVWGFTGVVSLPYPLTGHKSPHRGEFGFTAFSWCTLRLVGLPNPRNECILVPVFQDPS